MYGLYTTDMARRRNTRRCRAHEPHRGGVADLSDSVDELNTNVDISNAITIASDYTDSVTIESAVVKDGWVFIAISITNVPSGSYNIATLTSAYRPAVNVYFNVVGQSVTTQSAVNWLRCSSGGTFFLWMNAAITTGTLNASISYPMK